MFRNICYSINCPNGSRQIGPLANWAPSDFLWQIGPRQIGPRQIGPLADWAPENFGCGKLGPGKLVGGKLGPGKLGPGKSGPDRLGPLAANWAPGNFVKPFKLIQSETFKLKNCQGL